MDAKLRKEVSWVKTLPKDTDISISVLQYKNQQKRDHMKSLATELRKHEVFRDARYSHDIKAAYLLEWSQDRGKPFWEYEMSYEDLSLLWRFRASCMGLAHNTPYRYNNRRTCALCDREALETEAHILLECETTKQYREEIMATTPWLQPRRYENMTQRLIRMGKSRNHPQLASYIGKVLKNRKDLLAQQITGTGANR